MKEEEMKAIVESLGARYRGIQPYPGKPERNLILFDEPKTRSTLALKVSEFSEAKVREKLLAYQERKV